MIIPIPPHDRETLKNNETINLIKCQEVRRMENLLRRGKGCLHFLLNIKKNLQEIKQRYEDLYRKKPEVLLKNCKEFWPIKTTACIIAIFVFVFGTLLLALRRKNE